jgi:hypothetical protein
MDGVGEAASQNFQNPDWWVGGTVGDVSQWGLYGITLAASGGGAGDVPAAFQLGRFGLGAAMSFGIVRAPGDYFLDSVAGDMALHGADRNTRILLGLGTGTDPTDKAAVVIDGNTTANETRFKLYDITAGTSRRVSIAASDSCGTGYRCLRIPN